MDDLKEWSCWALEMIRRALHDYWGGDTWDDDKGKSSRGGGGKRGKGGEGCVIMVDANGAGYRNLVRFTHAARKPADQKGSGDATDPTGSWT